MQCICNKRCKAVSAKIVLIWLELCHALQECLVYLCALPMSCTASEMFPDLILTQGCMHLPGETTYNQYTNDSSVTM